MSTFLSIFCLFFLESDEGSSSTGSSRNLDARMVRCWLIPSPTHAHLFPKKPFRSGLPVVALSARRKDTLASIFGENVSRPPRRIQNSDTDLVRNQLADSVPRDGDVARPFSIVSHEHVDGAATEIKILSQTQKQYVRIEAINQRPILGLILDESQVECDHQVNEPIQYSLLFWFDNLAVNLAIPSLQCRVCEQVKLSNSQDAMVGR